jgi:hypothetical protein
MYEDDDEVEDNRADVINTAIQHNLGSKDEIQLYEHLIIALSLMNEKDFEINCSNINNGLNFVISTKYPDELPVRVGALFFNVDCKYDVHCEEDVHTINGCPVATQNRFYVIKIKKH